MNLAHFNISISETEKALKSFNLFRMRGIKSINAAGVSDEFKQASIKEDYVKAYTAGLKFHDFDFLLNDQSYFQFQFQKNKDVIDIRYAFFQNPINYISYTDYIREQLKLLDMSESLEDFGSLLEDDYAQYLNEQELRSNYTTIRYDSDFDNYRPLIHSVSHIHIGHLNNIRIPLNKIISPLKFVLFTIKHVYYQEWKDMIDGNAELIKEKLITSSKGELLLDKKLWTDIEALELHLK